MKVIYRKVNDTDIFEIQKLFLQVFNKKISKETNFGMEYSKRKVLDSENNRIEHREG